eukprot:tig00000133_g7689.t1
MHVASKHVIRWGSAIFRPLTQWIRRALKLSAKGGTGTVSAEGDAKKPAAAVKRIKSAAGSASKPDDDADAMMEAVAEMDLRKSGFWQNAKHIYVVGAIVLVFFFQPMIISKLTSLFGAFRSR